MMKNIILMHAFFVASLVWAQPKIVVPSKPIHLGTHIVGEEIHTSFGIANEGDAPLIIQRVQRSCECTHLSYPPSIPPYSQADVSVTIKGKDIAGPASISIVFMTNDPKKPKAHVTFKVLFESALHLEPAITSPLYLNIQGDHRFKLKVSSEEGIPFRITSVRTFGSDFHVASSDKESFPTEKKTSHDLIFTFHNVSRKPQQAIVLISYDLPFPNTERLEFTYAFKPPIYVDPSPIRMVLKGPPAVVQKGKDIFRVVRENQDTLAVLKKDGSTFSLSRKDIQVLNEGYTFRTSIRSVENKPFSVIDINCPLDLLCHIEKNKPAISIPLTLSYHGVYPQKPKIYKLSLKVNLKDYPVVEIPIFVQPFTPNATKIEKSVIHMNKIKHEQ